MSRNIEISKVQNGIVAKRFIFVKTLSISIVSLFFLSFLLLINLNWSIRIRYMQIYHQLFWEKLIFICASSE